MTSMPVWCEASGDGPLVVLVHGSMDRASSFRRMARHLTGWTALRYDRRGYGHSDGLGVAEHIDEQVDDLEGLLAGRRARFFGHSIGGVVALALAERRPDLVDGVVAYESPRPWVDWWPTDSAGSLVMADTEDPGAAAQEFMIAMIGEDRWLRLPPSTRSARRGEGLALVAELASIRPPNPPAYDDAAIRCPVISAHGSESRPHHCRTARDLAEHVPGARLEVVEGAAHGVHLSHPAEAARLVGAL